MLFVITSKIIQFGLLLESSKSNNNLLFKLHWRIHKIWWILAVCIYTVGMHCQHYYNFVTEIILNQSLHFLNHHIIGHGIVSWNYNSFCNISHRFETLGGYLVNHRFRLTLGRRRCIGVQMHVMHPTEHFVQLFTHEGLVMRHPNFMTFPDLWGCTNLPSSPSYTLENSEDFEVYTLLVSGFWGAIAPNQLKPLSNKLLKFFLFQ